MTRVSCCACNGENIGVESLTCRVHGVDYAGVWDAEEQSVICTVPQVRTMSLLLGPDQTV